MVAATFGSGLAGCVASCRRRHSGRSRAPMPAGPCFAASAANAQVVEQFLARSARVLVLARQQAGGDVFEAVFEVTVLVERVDQDLQRRALGGGELHAGQLLGQVLGQADVGRLGLAALAVIVATARWAVARQLADAVKVIALGAVGPVLAVGGAKVLGRQLALASGFSARFGAVVVVRRGVVRSAGALLASSGVLTLNSSSVSSSGLVASICSTSWFSSRVESCSNRMDCCNWGVSARCWLRRSCRWASSTDARPTCGSVRRDKPCGTSGLATISSGVPWASTVPSLMM